MVSGGLHKLIVQEREKVDAPSMPHSDEGLWLSCFQEG